MKPRGVKFLFALIATVIATLAANLVLTLFVVKSLHLYPQTGRYFLHTEETSEITVTTVYDAQTDTQLLYIADDSKDDPSISVLPVSREGISSVSVGPFSDDVMIKHSVEDDRILHAVMVSEEGFPSTLANSDTDKDGITDSRVVGFATESGNIKYFDLDADGTLDGYFITVFGGDAQRSCHILTGQRWIGVEYTADLFALPFMAKTLDTPPAIYHFMDGVWQESTDMVAE